MKTLVALLALLAALGPQDFGDLGRNPDPPPEDPLLGPQWLLVHGASEGVKELTWGRIASSYLMRFSKRVVGVDEAELFPASSRLVIGTPEENPLVRELAAGFGLVFERGLSRFRGELFGGDVGLVLVGPDPDGAGLLSLVTSSGAIGLQSCFTVTLDLTRPGYSVVRTRHLAESGALLIGLDLQRPRTIDLDLLVRTTVDRSAPEAPEEVALELSRTLEGWRKPLEAIAGRGLDLQAHLSGLYVPPRPEIAAAREHFAARDPAAEIAAAYDELLAALGEDAPARPAPLFHLLVDLPERTNARTHGFELSTGRARVTLNLGTLTGEHALRAAAIHESVHSLQDLGGEYMRDEAAVEGVAVYLTLLAAPELPPHVALMWSEEELAAADSLRGELVKAFLRDERSGHPQVVAAWMTLGARVTPVPGAPTRSAYYVAWRAAEAWLAADPARRPAQLLTLPASELFAALR